MSSPTILTLNAGSASLRGAVWRAGDGERRLLAVELSGIGEAEGRLHVAGADGATAEDCRLALPDHDAARDALLAHLDTRHESVRLDAVAHRFVHGGPRHAEPELVTPALEADLEALAADDPEHAPQALASLRALARRYPALPQVAPAPPPAADGPLSPALVATMDAYWRAANYLTVGQIYLGANPLLHEPLAPAHVKPRLLGHWGTSSGQAFVYMHLNRVARERNANLLYVSGPGHGGPALVAHSWLEGTYSEVHPEITRDAAGMAALFRSFSTPGGVPSHCGPHVPGSIHEGGELGYALLHAYGAAFDNPDLLVVCVVGDGEAETGPLEGSWKSVRFLNPRRDGAVLPILHLNGYEISGPTILGRTGDEDLALLFRGRGFLPDFAEGDDLPGMHQRFATALDRAVDAIRAIQQDARTRGGGGRPRWPMLVLRSPKGWTGPEAVDGQPIAGTFRAHQVPLASVRENPEHLRLLEGWLRGYRPEELFDEAGRPRPELTALVPPPELRLGASPHANGGRLLTALEPLMHPDAHPHGMDDLAFEALFTERAPVVFAYHGSPWVVHSLVHGRPNAARVHARGFVDRGTTTTPFDMVVLNGLSRFHLATLALRHVPRLHAQATAAMDAFQQRLDEHRRYTRRHLVDQPEIANWQWTDDCREPTGPPPAATGHAGPAPFSDA